MDRMFFCFEDSAGERRIAAVDEIDVITKGGAGERMLYKWSIFQAGGGPSIIVPAVSPFTAQDASGAANWMS